MLVRSLGLLAFLLTSTPLLLADAACSSTGPAANPNGGSKDANAADGGAADGAPVQTDGGPSPDPTPPIPPYPADETTTLVVGIDAEDFRQTLSVDLQTLHVVTTVDGKPATDETLDLRSGDAIPHETTLHAPKENATAMVEVTVSGFVPDGAGPPPRGAPQPNVVRRAATHFVAGQTRLLPLRLEARCASAGPNLIGGPVFLGPTCDAPTTCVAATCVNDEVAPAALLAYSKSWAEDMPDACRASADSLAVGGGETDYAPLQDGATVKIVEGPQCGHHLWVGAKMAGMRQYGTTTRARGTSPGTALVGPTSDFRFAYGDAGGGACQLGGLRYQLDGATGGTWRDFLGKPIDLTVTLVDPTSGKTQQKTLRLQIDADYTKGPRPCG